MIYLHAISMEEKSLPENNLDKISKGEKLKEEKIQKNYPENLEEFVQEPI